MSKTRIAVAGAGMIGRRHIEEIVSGAGTALSAIVDPAPNTAELARQYGVQHLRSIEELLAQDRPDGIVLATPNALHVAQAMQCIEAALPVLVEKPLATTLADGERLVRAAETAKALVLVGHHRRHSPILHAAVEIVASGVLGPLVGVIGSAVFYKPDSDGYYDAPYEWRRRIGGGPILLNMIHEIGNLRAMVGEIAAVQAFTSNATRQFEVEDTVAINFRFHNGTLGTFLLSDTAASPKSWEQTSLENKAYASYEDQDAYVILGTNGSLGVPTMRMHLYTQPSARSWHKPFDVQQRNVERADPLARQIAHFAAVIRGETRPLVTARDGLQNLRVTDAIERAAATGATVEIRID